MKKYFLSIVLLFLYHNVFCQNWIKIDANLTKSKSPISVFAFGNTVIVWDYDGDGKLVISTDDGSTWKKKDIVLNLDGNSIYADYVYFYNESLGFAFAGHGGKPYIYKTTNQGDSWALSFKNTASPPDQHDTWDMQFINPDVGFFCNTYEIHKTTNGGTTFSKINLPHQTVSGYDIMPEAFRFFDENYGYVVGNVTYNPNPFKKYNAAYTTDGGNSWQPVEIPWRKDNYQVTEIHSIDILKSDKNQVWVGGYNSQIGGIGGKFQYSQDGFPSSPSWKYFYLPDDPKESNRILQIQIMPDGYIWAQDGMIVYYFKDLIDYPQHWQLEGKFIKNISMLSPDKGWAIAENDIWKFTTEKIKSITITSPNGGEEWQEGSSHDITWSSSNVTNVRIDYSTDSGVNWNNIISDTPAISSPYSWTVPNTPSKNCKVKICSVEDNTICDESDNVFEISKILACNVFNCESSDIQSDDIVYTSAVEIVCNAVNLFTPKTQSQYGVYISFKQNLNAEYPDSDWNVTGAAFIGNSCPLVQLDGCKYSIFYKDKNLILNNNNHFKIALVHEFIHSYIDKYYPSNPNDYGWNEGLSDWGPYAVYGLDSYLYNSFSIDFINQLKNYNKDYIDAFRNFVPYKNIDIAQDPFWKDKTGAYRAAQYDFWKYFLSINFNHIQADPSRFIDLLSGNITPNYQDLERWRNLYLPCPKDNDGYYYEDFYKDCGNWYKSNDKGPSTNLGNMTPNKVIFRQNTDKLELVLSNEGNEFLTSEVKSQNSTNGNDRKFGFGKYSASIKISGDEEGSINAFFLYSDWQNFNGEIDFEIFGKPINGKYYVQVGHFHHNQNQQEVTKLINLNDYNIRPDLDYVNYEIVWEKHQIIWLINGIEVFKTTKNIPSEPLHIMFNHWLVNSQWGEPLKYNLNLPGNGNYFSGTKTMLIDWFKYEYLAPISIVQEAKNKGEERYDVILARCPITLMAINNNNLKVGIDDKLNTYNEINSSELLNDSIGGPMALILPPDLKYTYKFFAHDTGAFTIEVWKSLKEGYKYIKYEGYIQSDSTFGTLEIFRDTIKNDYGFKVDFNKDMLIDTVLYPIDYQTKLLKGVILYEDFEKDSLDYRLSYNWKALDSYTFVTIPGVVETNHFGSNKAFRYGNTNCPSECYYHGNTNFYNDKCRTFLRITFPVPTYITSISFMWSEMRGNWGEAGYVCIDSIPITEGYIGINPPSDYSFDESIRHYIYVLNKEVKLIDILIYDISDSSEIFIDNLIISNDYIYINDVENGIIFDNDKPSLNIYPNPTFSKASIVYYNTEISNVSLILSSIYGKIEKTIINNQITFPGIKSVDLNTDDLPSGIYFVTLQAGSYIETQKLVIIK